MQNVVKLVFKQFWKCANKKSFMINSTHFWSENLFSAYFAKFKFWATRIQETPTEPLITFL